MIVACKCYFSTESLHISRYESSKFSFLDFLFPVEPQAINEDMSVECMHCNCVHVRYTNDYYHLCLCTFGGDLRFPSVQIITIKNCCRGKFFALTDIATHIEIVFIQS